MSARRRLIIVAVLGAAALSTVGAAFAAGSARQGSPALLNALSVLRHRAHARAFDAALHRSHAHHVAPALLREFSVLRQRLHAHAADAPSPPLPPFVVQGMGLHASSIWGLLPSQTTFVSAAPGFGVWITPGSDGTCVTWGVWVAQTSRWGVDGQCDSIAKVSSGTLYMDISANAGPNFEPATDPVEVVGLVPNTNTSVDVTMGDGSVKTVPVVNNVYAVQGVGIRAVDVHDANGNPSTVEVQPWRP